MRWITISLTTIFVLLCTTSNSAAAPIPNTFVQEDPRLSKPVTVAMADAYVGEILDSLSQSAAVTLTADAQSGAPDERLAVYATGTKLVDLLNGIYSMLSYRSGEWHWSRKNFPGGYHYYLSQSAPAQRIGPVLDGQLQAQFEDHATEMLKGLSLPPDQLADFLRHDEVAAKLLSDDLLKQGLRVFDEELTPEMRQSVLRGQQEPMIPIDRLSEDGKKLVDAVAKRIIRAGEPQAPRWIRFKLSKVAVSVAPMMVIEVDGLGAYGYLGGPPLSQRFLSRVQDEWFLPGDSRTSALMNEMVPAPVSATSPRTADAPLTRRVREATEPLHVPVIIRLAKMRGLQLNRPYGKPLRAFLDDLKSSPSNIQYKWRSGVLLIADSTWFKGRSHSAPAPFSIVSKLRQSARQNEGILPLDAIGSALSTLNNYQVDEISAEFEVLKRARAWKPVLSIYSQSPTAAEDMNGKTGLLISQYLPLRESPPFGPIQEALKADTGARLFCEQISHGLFPAMEVVFRVTSGNGKQIARASFPNPEVQSVNLCVNGDFEDWFTRKTASFPSGWEAIGAPGDDQYLSADAEAGKYSGRVFAKDEQLCGLYWRTPRVRQGVVKFSYKVLRSPNAGANISFTVSPATNDESEKVAGTSSAGKSLVINAKDVGDGQWHSALIPFSFERARGTAVDFAALINHLNPSKGVTEVVFDNVRIYATEGPDTASRH